MQRDGTETTMKWLPLIALIVGGLTLLFRDQAQVLSGLDDSQFSRGLIAATLLAFIGLSVLAGYRGRLAILARHTGIWALMVTCLAGGYFYKNEVAEIAHRVTSELLPPADQQQTIDTRPTTDGKAGDGKAGDGKTTEGKTVRIRRRADGHFVARAKVGAGTVSALVDTGASTVVLSASDAKAIGLAIDRLSYTVPVQTANGIAYAAAVRLNQVSIGSIVLDGVDALVARPGALKESLLGISFLRRLRSYEFSGDFLMLRG